MVQLLLIEGKVITTNGRSASSTPGSWSTMPVTMPRQHEPLSRRRCLSAWSSSSPAEVSWWWSAAARDCPPCRNTARCSGGTTRAGGGRPPRPSGLAASGVPTCGARRRTSRSRDWTRDARQGRRSGETVSPQPRLSQPENQFKRNNSKELRNLYYLNASSANGSLIYECLPAQSTWLFLRQEPDHSSRLQ